MEWLKYFFSKGAKNTVALKGGTNFSYIGPWVKLMESPIQTRLDRWHLGEFCAVEYSIVADFDTTNREIVKCIVTAGKDVADLTIYGRSNLGASILNITATVNNSYVDIIATPSNEDSTVLAGAKVLYQATYFKTLNPPV